MAASASILLDAPDPAASVGPARFVRVDTTGAAALRQADRAQEQALRTALPTVSVGDAYDLLAQLGTATVDCVITSPPYWGLRDYGHDHDEDVLEAWKRVTTGGRTALSAASAPTGLVAGQVPSYEWYRDHGGVLGLEPYPDWYVAHVVEILGRARSALKPAASLWVNLGDTYFGRWSSIRADGRQGLGSGARKRRRTPSGGVLHDKQLLLVPSRVAIAMQNAGWILRNDLIWSKPDVAPRPETDRLRLSHEHFFHFVQRAREGRPKYHYDLKGAEAGSLDVVVHKARAGRDGHSATFPLALVAPRIASSCPPDGLVVDPFCGTGRALEAAVALGRRAHGIELSPTFAAAARRHVRNARIAAGLPDADIAAQDPSSGGRADSALSQIVQAAGSA